MNKARAMRQSGVTATKPSMTTRASVTGAATPGRISVGSTTGRTSARPGASTPGALPVRQTLA